MAKKRLAAAGAVVAISLVAHCAVLPGIKPALNAWNRHMDYVSQRADESRREGVRQKAQRMREQLVNEIRSKVNQGKSISIGEFIIRTNEIDALEEGAEVNHSEAREMHEHYVSKLRGALSKGMSAPEAIPRVLGDISYHDGTANMAEALEERGGRCALLAP